MLAQRSRSTVFPYTTLFRSAISTGSGPILKISGSPVSATVCGTWAPIAAEQTGSGYDVAWKDSATGHFARAHAGTKVNRTTHMLPYAKEKNATFQRPDTIFH